MTEPPPSEILQALHRMGLMPAATPVRGERLTGGVSSDIWRIDLPSGPICIKRALAKLRVAADWQAPVERNRYEARWMRRAVAAVPGAAPKLLGSDEASGALAMQFLPPDRYPLWKAQLRDGHADPAFAAQVAATLARIHAATAADPTAAADFPTDRIFYDIRLEPYLVATGRAHPGPRPATQRAGRDHQANKRALVHGDVSPKNILRGPDGPVFLDAECAWWGDPAFDLAFCLNHLLLKCLWTPRATRRLPRLLRCAGRRPTSPASPGNRRPNWKPAPRVCCPACFSPGWMGSRRSSTSRRTRTGTGSAASRGRCWRTRSIACRNPPGLGEGACRMTDTAIAFVHGRRVWDSRGRPTVEAEVLLEGGSVGRAIAPAGASTGTGEALDLRDGGDAFGGYDVTRAVGHVNGEIARAVTGLDAADQAALDRRLIDLDGTPSKSRLGGNAMLAVSMAAAHAAAAAAGRAAVSLPGRPRRFMLSPCRRSRSSAAAPMPAGASTSRTSWSSAPPPKTFAQALDWTAEVYRAAGALMKQAGTLQGVADEGGWWPAFATNEQALETLVRAIERAGFTPGSQVAIALDIAASEFGRGGKYKLALEDKELDSDGMIKLLTGWIRRYPIVSIEDPLAEDDVVGFAAFTHEVGDRVQIIGDDFLVTQAARVREAALRGTANAVLLKPNQRGTLTETFEAWQAAQQAGFAGIVSARSGETEDVTIVHLAVGWGVGQLKVGSFARSERMAKWNEALRVEETLGARARFAGGGVLGRSK